MDPFCHFPYVSPFSPCNSTRQCKVSNYYHPSYPSYSIPNLVSFSILLIPHSVPSSRFSGTPQLRISVAAFQLVGSLRSDQRDVVTVMFWQKVLLSSVVLISIDASTIIGCLPPPLNTLHQPCLLQGLCLPHLCYVQ